jgi:hypothetical protein
MAKIGFWELTELGASTAKKTVKSVAKTFNPLPILDQTPNSSEHPPSPESPQSPKSHTELDFEKLQKKYADQDAQKTEILRQRLFQLVKGSEEKILMEKKQEELEKKRKEAYEEQEKKRREEEKKKKEAAPIPMGKIRRSIFTPLKVAKRQTAEVRPSAGKQ